MISRSLYGGPVGMPSHSTIAVPGEVRGVFRLSQNLEDAEALLSYLRDPANAARLGIDRHRIVIAGHSMGGWIVVQTAAHDHELIGAILISAADVGKQGELPHDSLVSMLASCMGPLSGTTPEHMADEMQGLSKKFRFEDASAGLTQIPILALTANDGFAPYTDALVRAIEAHGGHDIRTIHVPTDHNWSDHRVWLASTVLIWLNELNREPAKDSSTVPLSMQTTSVK